MLTFGIALIVGLWFVGKEVIKTVGTISRMHPASGLLSRAFCRRRRDGRIIYGLACFQYPYLGRCSFGYRRLTTNANWKLMKPIGLAWVITLPAAAVLSVVSYLVLQAVF